MPEQEHISPEGKPEENLDLEKYVYYENGLMVFKEAYHLMRGYCCERGCRHCPYGFKTKNKAKKP